MIGLVLLKSRLLGPVSRELTRKRGTLRRLHMIGLVLLNSRLLGPVSRELTRKRGTLRRLRMIGLPSTFSSDID